MLLSMFCGVLKSETAQKHDTSEKSMFIKEMEWRRMKKFQPERERKARSNEETLESTVAKLILLFSAFVNF